MEFSESGSENSGKFILLLFLYLDNSGGCSLDSPESDTYDSAKGDAGMAVK